MSSTFTLNTFALECPRDRLLPELMERIERKRATLQEWDDTLGGGRIRIGSYMENLALPELFGFDMNQLFTDHLPWHPHAGREWVERLRRVGWVGGALGRVLGELGQLVRADGHGCGA